MKGTGLAGRLRAARAQAGLTQAELARRVNIARSSVADYETGRCEPDPERLACLASALGVPLGFFFPTSPLLPREPVRVLTPRQAVELQARRKGHPRGGGWFMVRPEHWSERLGAIVWVEVTRGCGLTAVYPPETVLGIVQGVVLPGSRAVGVAEDGDLVIGEVMVEAGQRLFIGSALGIKPAEDVVLGSVAVVVEAAAARALRLHRREESGG